MASGFCYSSVTLTSNMYFIRYMCVYFVPFREVVPMAGQSVVHVATSLAHVLFATVHASEAVDDTGRETVEGRIDGVNHVVGMRHDRRVSGETGAHDAALVGA